MAKHRMTITKREISVIKVSVKAEFLFDCERGCVVRGERTMTTTVQTNTVIESVAPGGRKHIVERPSTIALASIGTVTLGK
jgi:hypothetical protein